MNMMEQPSNDKIYQKVPRKYVDELMEFRSTHPIRSRVTGGKEWNYILSGDGVETILILGGAMSTAETSRTQIIGMEKTYRVLSPSYPVYDRMGELIDDLLRLLDLEGIPRAHVYGHSLGASIGHVLIRRHPDRIDKLILSSFGLYNERNLRRAKSALRLFDLFPYWFVTGYYKRRMPKLLTGMDEQEKSFWIAYTKDILDRQLNKKTLVGQFKLMGDMLENPGTYGIYEPVQNSNVLILQAKDDTGFAQDEQEALRRTYPNASVHLFEEGGHLMRATHQSEYDAVMYEFLESANV